MHLTLHIGSPCVWFQYFSSLPLNNILFLCPDSFPQPVIVLSAISVLPHHGLAMNMLVFSFRTTYLFWILLKVGEELTKPVTLQKMETWSKVFLTLNLGRGLNVGMSRAEKAEVQITDPPPPELPHPGAQRGIHRGA